MAEAQEAAWHGLLDLYDRHPGGWTLIGGQLVHLHCAERGFSPQRPTDDADAVVNARQPDLLGAVTSALIELGFAADGVSAEGIQHRWKRDKALIDVLVPEGMGERATAKRSASGFPTLATPGGTQALNRSEVVEVQLGERTGHVVRPNLIGTMVLKAAARTETTGAGRDRHCYDFATLVAMLGAADLRDADLQRTDRKRLRLMIEHTRQTPGALESSPSAAERLTRLERALA
jgi:hypothetical protein